MADLSSDDIARLQSIPDDTTKTLGGASLNMACRNWALTGGTEEAADWITHVFGLVNLSSGANPLYEAIKAQPYDDNAGMDGQQQFDRMVKSARSQVGLRDRAWADRQRRKLESGGKYTNEYMTEKIVRRAVERSGLQIGDEADARYYLCMHYLTTDGVAEEHWWIAVWGVMKWYTVEIIPRWPEVKIYGPRRDDPANYARVVVPLKSLHKRHVDRISNVLRNGSTCQTPQFPGTLDRGWS
jgi:hypothetical protein